MADNEGENGESDPGSIDNGQPSIHSEKEADTSFVDIPHQVNYFYTFCVMLIFVHANNAEW